MHDLYMQAQQRIDAGLACIAVCVAWAICLPLSSFLFHMHLHTSLFILAGMALPFALLAVRPFLEGLRVVRAVEERDLDEIERWAATAVRPARMDLLVARRHRTHVAPLRVCESVGVVMAVICGVRLVAAVLRADEPTAFLSAGIALIFLAGVGASAALIRQESILPQTLLRVLGTVSVCAALGLAVSGAVLMRFSSHFVGQGISEGVTSAAMVVLGIIGLVCALCAVVLAIFLFLQAGKRVRAQQNQVNADGVQDVNRFGLRTLVAEMIHLEAQDVARAYTLATVDTLAARDMARPSSVKAPAQFDMVDVRIIREAMRLSRVDRFLGTLIFVIGVAIVLFSFVGALGSVGHGILGIILAILLAIYVWRLRDIR